MPSATRAAMRIARFPPPTMMTSGGRSGRAGFSAIRASSSFQNRLSGMLSGSDERNRDRVIRMASSRCAFLGSVRSMPYGTNCLSSPLPTLSETRPPEIWSSVSSDCARCAGVRRKQSTIGANRMRLVCAASVTGEHDGVIERFMVGHIVCRRHQLRAPQ